MLYETHALQQACAAQTGLRKVPQAYFMTRVFFENNFAESAGKKKNSRFHPAVLVAFPISNISYWSLCSALVQIKG